MAEMDVQLHSRQRRVRRELEELSSISNHLSHQLEENRRNKRYVDGETAHHLLEAALLARDFLGSDSSSDRTTRSSLASHCEPDETVSGKGVSEVAEVSFIIPSFHSDGSHQSNCTATPRLYCPRQSPSSLWTATGVSVRLPWHFCL